MVQGVQALGMDMRVVRLPAIHHDANLVVIDGSVGNLLIDAGTSWYQGLQVERVKGLLEIHTHYTLCPFGLCFTGQT